MKCDHSLKVSGAITEVMLITKCCVKKITRNNPESAITHFLASDDLTNALMYKFLICCKDNFQASQYQS